MFLHRLLLVTMLLLSIRVLVCFGIESAVEGWLSSSVKRSQHFAVHNPSAPRLSFRHLVVPNKNEEEEEWSDFADMGYSTSPPLQDYRKEDISTSDDDLNAKLRLETQRRQTSVDYTAVSSRQLSLGKDLIVTNYVGDMGFDEVTDWQYYYQDEDEDGRRQGDRKVVQPNPLDSTK